MAAGPGHSDIILPWMDPKLSRAPGMQPLKMADWLVQDALYNDHMAQRDRLIAAQPDQVLAAHPLSGAALAELYDIVSAQLILRPGYECLGESWIRPDAAHVRCSDLLMRLGRLVAEDLLILMPEEGEYRLRAGVLCFPSHWTLAEKMGRTLLSIHAPVPFYAETLAARVQRLFDAIRPETPLWRMNWLFYPDSSLHTPASERQERQKSWSGPLYLRTERQCLIRLPNSRAVVFSIKTDITPVANLPSPAVRAALEQLAAMDKVEHEYKGGDALQASLSQILNEGMPSQ